MNNCPISLCLSKHHLILFWVVILVFVPFQMSNFYYEIKLPAQQKAYLGLVLDTQTPKNGYKILSTTPGSIADKLDILVGDTIKSINGVKVDIINHTKALEQLKQPIVDSTLNLTVESKGKIKIISSKIVTNYIPEINIEIGKKSVALAVKVNALQKMENNTVIFERKGNNFTVRAIEVGEQDDNWVEVLSGLQAEAEYVSENSFIIKADILKSGASHDH